MSAMDALMVREILINSDLQRTGLLEMLTRWLNFQ